MPFLFFCFLAVASGLYSASIGGQRDVPVDDRSAIQIILFARAESSSN